MLSFTRASAYYILSGEKTQTRRVWKRSQVKEGNEYWATMNRFSKDGRFARIKVVNLREWDGKRISTEDAWKEGFPNTQEFWQAYRSLNRDKLNDPDRKQYIIDFEVTSALKTAMDISAMPMEGK